MLTRITSGMLYLSVPSIQPASDIHRIAFRSTIRADGGGYGEHVQKYLWSSRKTTRNGSVAFTDPR
jgi:hypothetical protein